jgi:uncharacterized protein
VIGLLALMQIGNGPVRNAIMTWREGDPQVEELRREAVYEAQTVERHRSHADDGESSYAAVTAGRGRGYSGSIHGFLRVERILINDILLLFFIGMYAARRRVFETAAGRRRGFVVLGAASALAIALGHGYTALELDWGNAAEMLQGWAVDKGPTFLYIAVIALLFTTLRAATRALSVFAAPGRMALTIYLMQSVVLTLLLQPYGFGLTLTTTAQLLFNLAFFFLLQVPLSHWWLSRYRYGPAEWLWRSATYGAAQPMRRRTAPVADVRDPSPLVVTGVGHR